MNKRLKLALFIAATVAFFGGMSVALAEPYACKKCRWTYEQCLANGGGDVCWFNYEACLVRSGCWVN